MDINGVECMLLIWTFIPHIYANNSRKLYLNSLGSLKLYATQSLLFSLHFTIVSYL